MSKGSLLFIVLVSLPLLIGAVRLRQRRADAKRRRREREAWQGRQRERRQADTRAHVLQEVKRFFPYVQESVEHRLAAGESPREALKAALEVLAGVEVGATENGVRIAMPSSLRSRHVVMWGRSGAGKSTLMLHLVKADMDEDRAVVVLCPEAEFFTALLGLATERAEDVIYLAPSDPLCPITFGPLQLDGDEETSHATELFSTAIKRALGEDSIGPRADPLLANAIGLVVGRPDATLERVRQVLTDDSFRERAIGQVRDPYVARFWRDVFPTFPAGATGPLLSRLDGFLRVEAIRRVLGHGKGSFTIRQVVEGGKRLFIDLSGLTPEMMLLFGGLITAKLELELLRRERGLVAAPAPVSVYVDEFPAVCGLGEGSWATLLSRSRKYNVSLCLAGQFPDQVPLNLRRQIAGNVATLASFALSARDAAIVSRELLVPSSDGSLKPIPAGELVALAIGTGYLRIGNAACGLKVMFKPPLSRSSEETVERVRRLSWRRHASPPADARIATSAGAASPGRGGSRHKLLQRLVRSWAQAAGYRAVIEHEVLDGAGRVDVALERDGQRVAIEVAVTSTPEQVLQTATRCLAAGFVEVIVVSPVPEALARAETIARNGLSEDERGRVRFLSPERLRAHLQETAGAANDKSRSAGYKVTVTSRPAGSAEDPERRRALARVVGNALLRLRSDAP